MIVEAKNEIRRRMRAMRDKVSIIEMMELSARICGRVLQLEEYRRAQNILCYSHLNGEVATIGLMDAIGRDGKALCLPRVADRTHMEAVFCANPDRDLVRGAYGILEPVGDRVIQPEQIDLVLVPGLAFTRGGDRLGYGAGFYDRFLPLCERAVRVGLCYEKQIVEVLPTEDFDCKMRYVVTEQRLFRCEETIKETEK
ncbi:MAG: 5-formyltetrahydrofolate cyclo-ligase [Christensenellales bacterium]